MRGTVPWLVKVIGFEAVLLPTFLLPKFKNAGEKLTDVPVPESETVWGLFGALSVTVNVPLATPFRRRRKRNLNLAALTRPQVSGTVVALAERASRRNVAYGYVVGAGVRQGCSLWRTRRVQ